MTVTDDVQHRIRLARSARGLLRSLAWTGGTISALCLIAGIAGLATVETIGPAPGNVWADLGLGLFIAALLLPFVTYLIHLAIALWVDDHQRWSGPRYGTPATVLGSVGFAMAAASLATLALFPFLARLAGDDGEESVTFVGALIIGLLLGAITVSAIAGGIAVMGWKGVMAGIALGFGFGATTYGLMFDAHPWTWAGIAALVLSTLAFISSRRRREL